MATAPRSGICMEGEGLRGQTMAGMYMACPSLHSSAWDPCTEGQQLVDQLHMAGRR